MLQRAVFLDRDGVLNQAIIKNGKPYPPANLTELIIASDVTASLIKLKAAGFKLIGATNQPDVARGVTTHETVVAINNYLLNNLPLDDIVVCFHDDSANCHCRKPLPGLLQDAAKKYQLDLAASVMIGDRWKDIAAGQQAGCKTIWLNLGYHEKAPVPAADYVCATLAAAAEWVINYY